MFGKVGDKIKGALHGKETPPDERTQVHAPGGTPGVTHPTKAGVEGNGTEVNPPGTWTDTWPTQPGTGPGGLDVGGATGTTGTNVGTGKGALSGVGGEGAHGTLGPGYGVTDVKPSVGDGYGAHGLGDATKPGAGHMLVGESGLAETGTEDAKYGQGSHGTFGRDEGMSGYGDMKYTGTGGLGATGVTGLGGLDSTGDTGTGGLGGGATDGTLATDTTGMGGMGVSGVTGMGYSGGTTKTGGKTSGEGPMQCAVYKFEGVVGMHKLKVPQNGTGTGGLDATYADAGGHGGQGAVGTGGVGDKSTGKGPVRRAADKIGGMTHLGKTGNGSSA